MKADNEITYEEALRHLDAETIAPCYLIYGEEPFFIDRILRRLLEKGVEEEWRDFNYNRLDGDLVSPDEIVLIARSGPMAGPRRVVVLDNAEKIKDPEERLLSYLASPSLTTILIFVAQKPDRRAKLFSILKGRATLIHCRPLYENEAPRFIRQEANRQGVRLTEEDIWLLKEYLGQDPYLIQKELEKLSLTQGATTLSTPTGALRHHSVFELTAAVGEKDATKALQILAFLLSEGEVPLIILAMLIRHFRMMLTAKEGLQWEPESSVRKRLSMPPSRIALFIKQVRLWTGNELRSAFDLFRKVDGRLKGGQTASSLVLEGLILELLQPVSPSPY